MITPQLQKRIDEFKERFQQERDFCEQLFQEATVRLMAAKYAYYVHSNPFIDDTAYDIAEKSWYVMGIALGHLKEEETSPCVDFDENHPKAKEGMALAKKLMKK
nr:hypothetical protein BdHM001_34810 [Bdellovibrio sp. HM001]